MFCVFSEMSCVLLSIRDLFSFIAPTIVFAVVSRVPSWIFCFLAKSASIAFNLLFISSRAVASIGSSVSKYPLGITSRLQVWLVVISNIVAGVVSLFTFTTFAIKTGAFSP